MAVLILTFAGLLSAPGAMAQVPQPASAGAESQARTDEAKSEKDRKEARKARREHRRMVNHRIRRKH